MKKSISIEKFFSESPFYDRIGMVRRAGFDAVEFCQWSHLDLARLQDTLAEQQVGVACISGDEEYSIIVPEERTAFLDFLARSIEAAKRLDCRNLYIHSNAIGANGLMSRRGMDSSAFTKIAAATRALVEAAMLAEKEEVYLQVEPVSTHVLPGYFMNTTPSAGDVIRVVNSPHVRLLYDVYHMQLMEGNITDTIMRYRDVLGYIHIADVPGRHEPGTGEINYAHLKATLESIGYDGIVGFELTPHSGLARCMESIHSF